MRRKEIEQGKGGHTITLPIQWIRENNIDQTKEVEILEQDCWVIEWRKQEKTASRHSTDWKSSCCVFG